MGTATIDAGLGNRPRRGGRNKNGYCPHSSSHFSRGFTLIELVFVMFMIGVIAAITFPQLVQVIAFSELEGDARHLANYGRGIVAEATLLGDEITVYFDLGKDPQESQEYWAVRWVYPDEGEGEAEADIDQLGLMAEMQRGDKFSPERLLDAFNNGKNANGLLGEDMLPDGFDAELAQSQLNDKFNRFARRILEQRAENVIHDEGFLEEIGPLFDPEDEFNLDEDEPVEEEIMDPILQRTRLTDGAWIETVSIGGESYTSGLVELELTPLGLEQKVGFHVVNGEGDCYTVIWDPLTGGANVTNEKEDLYE